MDVAATIVTHHLLEPGARVLAMLSGGADSTLLVHVLHELGYDVRALHVAHSRRGAESVADADLCAAICDRLGVTLVIADGHLDGEHNVEARLRDVRRAAAVAAAAGDPIATGHTASDRAETVLYRLATSGGARALSPLPARAGQWIRPLLAATREEVRAELNRRRLAWREDRSNLDDRHARNRIRNHVVPELERLNPAAVRNIARTAEIAEAERAFVDAAAAALIADDGSIDLDALAAAHVALQRAALRLGAARAGVRIQHRDIEALRVLGRAGRERRSLPGGAFAERDRASLRFVR